MAKITEALILSLLTTVAIVQRLWWTGMQNRSINWAVWPCTIGFFSALPYWIYRWHGEFGLYFFLVGVLVFLAMSPFALALNYAKGHKDHTEVSE